MRLDLPYQNRKLEAKRQAALARQKADAALKRQRQQRLRERRTATTHLFASVPNEQKAAARRLVEVVDRWDLLESGEPSIRMALRALVAWHRHWLRDPRDWRPTSYNARRRLGSLLRHVLARYPVPAWLDDAFLRHAPPTRKGKGGREQRWFVHVAQGQNLRTARDLPFPLTRKQAHHAMLAPPDAGIVGALRWGQVRGAGGSESLARALCGSFLADEFASAEAEEFWQEVIVWLCRSMVDEPLFALAEVAPLLDYLRNQKFVRQGRVWRDGQFVDLGPPHPDLSMKGRTLRALLRQMRRWHAELGRADRLGDARRLVWGTCGIAGLELVEGTRPRERLISVVELVSGGELLEEGRRMHHCVGSYVRWCAGGERAIFSLRVNDAGTGLVRRVTIEVDVARRQVVQARGKANVLPAPLDYRWLRQWTTSARLTLSRWVAADAERRCSGAG